MIRLLAHLFGCAHNKTTFPITPVSRNGRRGQTYVICVGCARQFAYSWDDMRIGAEIRPDVVKTPALETLDSAG